MRLIFCAHYLIDFTLNQSLQVKRRRERPGTSTQLLVRGACCSFLLWQAFWYYYGVEEGQAWNATKTWALGKRQRWKRWWHHRKKLKSNAIIRLSVKVLKPHLLRCDLNPPLATFGHIWKFGKVGNVGTWRECGTRETRKMEGISAKNYFIPTPRRLAKNECVGGRGNDHAMIMRVRIRRRFALRPVIILQCNLLSY